MAANCKICSDLIEENEDDEDDEDGICLNCHLKENQKFRIREAYRWRKEKQTFDDLSKDEKKRLEYILKRKYAVLKFEVEGTGKKKTKKTFSFNDYHRHGDLNFFGDRPGVYAFHTDKKNVKVGESRNLSQRLRGHKGKLMSIGTKGFIVFSCKDGLWPDDPMNSSELRLTIERILQANFKVKLTKKKVEKWVTPTSVQLKLAIEICREIVKMGKSWSWLEMKEDDFVLPRI